LLNVLPVMLAELSPAKQRGAVLGLTQLSVNAGVAVAFALPLAAVTWRTAAWLATLPLLVLLTATLGFLPESPSWLARAGRRDSALSSLRWLHGPTTDVTAELRSLKDDEQGERCRATLRELHKPLSLLLFFHCAQQLCGINSVFFNIKSLLDSAGIRHADHAAVAVVLAQLPFSVLACVLLDRAGRRWLLVSSCLGTALAAAVMSAAFSMPASASSSRMALVGALGYRTAFSLGLGPVPWVLSGELMPESGRGIAASAATIINSLANVAVTLSFGRMRQSWLGLGGTFGLYSASCFAAAAVAVALLPETKGRSLASVGASWTPSTPQRDAESGGDVIASISLTRARPRR